MNITFDCPDKINGLLTMTIEQSDYQESVEKQLKDMRRRANVPGFRPGMVPMGLIKRQYGEAAKYDAVNKLVDEKLFGYIRENKIQMLGSPMPAESQQPQDLKQDGPFTFVFDIAVAPEFELELTSKDKIDYYNIEADDKLIQSQVDMFCQQAGQLQDAEQYAGGSDSLRGDLRQLDETGNTLEGGITVAEALVMPTYFKDEDEKKKFEGAKMGDILTFNPRKAYSDTELASVLKLEKEQVQDLQSDFTFQVTEIKHFQPAAVDQKLFDRIYGEGNVKSEKEFRQKIAESLAPQLTENSQYKFLLDVRDYCEKKVGELTFPDALLKRVMLDTKEGRDEKYVEEHYADSIKALKWQLIEEKLVQQTGIKVTDDDLKQVAKAAIRAQFAQYGMNDIPEDVLENYADEQLKKKEEAERYVSRAIDVKLAAALKDVVKLNEKKTTLDEFNKMLR